jgi:hypothetical protein
LVVVASCAIMTDAAFMKWAGISAIASSLFYLVSMHAHRLLLALRLARPRTR